MPRKKIRISREDLKHRATITVPEARSLTGLTSRTIIDRIHDGAILGKKMDGGKGMYLIDAVSFNDFISVEQ